MPKIIGNPTVTPVMPSDWAQKDETKVDYIKNKPTKLSQFENDVEFVDREELDDALSGIGGNVDMSDYYTKGETREVAREIAEQIVPANLEHAVKSVGDGYYATEEQVSTKQNTITGSAGQFVVIGSDGNVTTKTIPIAEEATF